MSPLEIATRFARALDRDDFDAARPLLCETCAYTIRDNVLRGPDAILASYRAATEDAHAKFDRVEYASDVSMLAPNVAVIEFSDVLTHRGETHHHKCHQRITIGETGQVTAIEHIDLPGEREAIKAYLIKVGLEEPA